MPLLTVIYGIIMILLGLGGYFGTGMLKPGEAVSMTALIPSIFGVIALLLGFVAFKAGARKHAMHGAAMVALLAVIAPAHRLIKALIGGTFDMGRPATVALLLMFLISVLFLAMCVRSFILARRARLLITRADL